MWRSIGVSALLYCVLTTMLSSNLPVLDEESYLYIAKEMPLFRPYDWKLPWHPWSDSYVYAHPPLFLYWVRSLWWLCGEDVAWLKFFLGLPFRIMLGAAAGYLCIRFSKNPKHSFLLWLSAPIVLMVGARSLMPDLMVCALGTLSISLFLGSTRRWIWFLSGLLLGLACWTKYPALLLWIPILYHQRQTRRLWPVFLGFILVWGSGELWLYFLYHRMHLWVVLETATQIARSGFAERGIGLLLRILIGAPVLMLLLRFRTWAMGGAFALVGLVFLPSLSFLGIAVSIFWISLSLGALIFLVHKPQIFQMWAIAIIVGVWATHNFASPRYLALSILPIAILVGEFVGRKGYILAGLSALLSLGIAYSESKYADSVHQTVQKIETSDGFFSGEWTMRWSLRQRGWRVWRGEKGSLIQAKQAAGGDTPRGLRLIETYTSNPHYLLLLDRDRSVGYYSETLGYWPLGFRYGAMEEFRLWEP
ncbi:MAG: hypothetical protein VX278_23745 [Myxococcota bacterium]|nr:hypothetical protein [Myxococcota bacterium]